MGRKRTTLTEVEIFYVDGNSAKHSAEEIAAKLGVSAVAVAKRIKENPPKEDNSIDKFGVHTSGAVVMTEAQSCKGDAHHKNQPIKPPPGRYEKDLYRPGKK